ncbi:Kelch repeat-containing protein [Platanthera guangdongensis]|uniref:Kelch repeat-containing protein n=1 Tax=Platanthera guangdongensis TaxID=2320717 RepID=A0ABR2LS06_9ASPA
MRSGAASRSGVQKLWRAVSAICIQEKLRTGSARRSLESRADNSVETTGNISGSLAACWIGRLRCGSTGGQIAKKSSRAAKDKDLKDLNATFADLPAPELEWEEMAEAPVPRLDGSAIQIKNLLYVFAGYGNINYVHSHVDMYDFIGNTWVGRFDMPKEMAHSHLGMATDGRYIYIVTGQHGPQCRGPTARNFVLDTETKNWHDLPPLPFPRYAPATQLWRGRLHVMGGSKEDRHEPALEHWSLPVMDGKALEQEWHTEVPIPRGGPHRSGDHKIVVRCPVVGALEEDQITGRLDFSEADVDVDHGVVYGDVYMLDDGLKWKNLPPMPKPDSHIEFAWKVVNNSVIIAGGTTEKHPVSKKMVLVGEVFQFNLGTLRLRNTDVLEAESVLRNMQEWSVIGRLPFRIKTTLVGFWDGWLYFTSGQRDKGPGDPSPKKVVGCMWRTKLRL